MRPCTAVTISIVAALLLAGCSPKAVINQSSETLPSTTVTPAVEDTHMIVCAETEQVIREPVYEASAASTFSQETDGTEIGEDATPAHRRSRQRNPSLRHQRAPQMHPKPAPQRSR